MLITLAIITLSIAAAALTSLKAGTAHDTKADQSSMLFMSAAHIVSDTLVCIVHWWS